MTMLTMATRFSPKLLKKPLPKRKPFLLLYLGKGALGSPPPDNTKQQGQ